MINSIIADILEENLFGTIAYAVNDTTFGIYVSLEPASKPIKCITTYATSGINPVKTMEKTIIENEGFQIRVRSQDKEECYNKIKAIQLFFDELNHYTINGQRFLDFTRSNTILDLGRFEEHNINYYIYTLNYMTKQII